uniref:Uncharacterized protein n=1 Tax=Romanomermis culicivorax TaxID=13658 RepID=A0A915JUX1_ROMCU
MMCIMFEGDVLFLKRPSSYSISEFFRVNPTRIQESFQLNIDYDKGAGSTDTGAVKKSCLKNHGKRSWSKNE